eukprot:1666172-Ditylum_brightwellii.AAC.1
MEVQNGMERIKAKIHHKYEWAVPVQRKGDKHIMDEFLESKLIPENVVKPLNYCRELPKRGREKHRLAPGTWPQHVEPDKSVMKLWKYALMKT